jgi:putative transposase
MQRIYHCLEFYVCFIMPNTYSQIHLHCVFATKFRASLIQPAWKDRLAAYMTGIIQNKGHKMLCINSMPDHIHFLFGFRPHDCPSTMIGIVKKESAIWVNDEGLCKSKFQWQEGFGLFAHSKQEIPRIATYIERQQEHHSKISFLDEYRHLLKEFDIEYDERYIFRSPV